ncbi:MAG: T9SS type A sorting domain-containing protein [Flavobacteriales bacterium]|nr:T9SS type A sorting domain-containing protein [Flavobacteriales bacterium]MBK7296853.1 T9SS type A sorting domain-containing protein [Flavobacteriales bacterium]MBK9536922.1 T9SS type A sorting domain-containing protein [Flavobacteriales bacterium]MBP9139411.1 T9SS type A sorting domain-containing protein [Flavobacteriales bacterium]HQV53127.1 two-component regulator propeller domain-containing protein [Flavobacteriales bacterium]
MSMRAIGLGFLVNCCFVILTFLFTASSVNGQTWEVFDMANAGLPSNTVNAFAHEDNGTTWVGTDWGLCKYDGSTWEVFQVDNSDIPENDVRALALDDQNRLWVGFFTQGLSVYDGVSWQHFNMTNSPLPTMTVRNIVFAADGFGWLSTADGVVRTDLSDWRIYNDSETSYDNLILPGNNISDIAIRNDGLVCVGTLNAGFVYLTDTLVRVFSTTTTGLPDNTALGVAIDSNGERWAACPFGGVLHNFGDYVNGFWSQYYSSNSSIPSNSLNDIIIDGQDRKIIATQQAGIAILSTNDTWEVFNMANSGLPDNVVNQLSFCTDGSIWVGTASGGAVRWDVATSLSAVEAPRAEFEIYPVPATTELNIRAVGVNRLDNYRVTDATGSVVLTGRVTGNGGMISVESLESGVYVFQIGQDNSLRSKHFIVL